MEQQRADIFHMPPYWLDTDDPDDYQELQEWLADDPINVRSFAVYYGLLTQDE
tara:strand:- start:999 stop:1157 length:159 start_codon:yes stop_codon:yes gene_type:complete